MLEHHTLPIATFLPYMPDVGKCERSLHELNLMWRIIEASAKMNCPVEARTILPTMAATRAGFGELEDELVTSLVHEKMRNVQAELATKAQYVIDIVVRNLYERTADVGFLATDRDVCAFVAGLDGNADAMRLRLRSYRSKYTVYDEIILLDLKGNVLVQIDEATPLEGSKDPLIALTLATDGYVETFRASDLRPAKREALIYSRRVCHPVTGAVVGVLCLCFHFEGEMEKIFSTHSDAAGRSNMLLLDAGNRVIASADPLWIAPGAQVPVNREGNAVLQMFAGRKYLVRTFGSEGYQGYPGPAGWQGQVMIPVDVAFSEEASAVLAELDPDWSHGLLSYAEAFCPPLFDIMGAADMIRRVVWNGQVMTAGQDGDLERLKTVLEQISETGARSNALFSRSIHELFETVLASGLRDTEFVSHLMVDLLDRNLYERANDCRWWALSPELRALLAGSLPDRAERMARVLEFINGLYTVYTRLVIYDRDGVIIAASGYGTETHVDQSTLAHVLALRSEQDYYVTPFAPSPLYGGRSTYVYHAAIRAPGDNAQVIGGIGIVFDAERELDAMLRGALAGKDGAQAMFINREGIVIASTDPARPIASRFEIGADFSALGNGMSTSRILIHDDHYAIMGGTASHGYREFKVTDGYRDDVIAVVVRSFGPVRQNTARGSQSAILLRDESGSHDGDEFATFYIDGTLFAMAAIDVHEALPASRVTTVSMGACAQQVGVLALDAAAGERGRCIWVFDLGMFLTGRETAVDHNAQVIVVGAGARRIGLLVSELHGVSKFHAAQLKPTPLAGSGHGMLVRQVITANQGEILIQLIDTESVFDMLANVSDEALPRLQA